MKAREQTAPKGLENLRTRSKPPDRLGNLRTSRKPLQRNRKRNKPCERDERMYEQGTNGSKGIRQLENKPENFGRRRKPLNREGEKLRERNPPLERHCKRQKYVRKETREIENKQQNRSK